jgi:hypothetical protein
MADARQVNGVQSLLVTSTFACRRNVGLADDEKVVIKQSMLNGSPDPHFLQRVAVVYIRGKEYRVSAPPEAKGNALDWIRHWAVRESATDFFQGESESEGAVRILVMKLVGEELRKHKALEPGRTGKHPDGDHCAAQICMTGHVRHCDGNTFNPEEYCSECGTRCIDTCLNCGEPIRGTLLYRPASDYQRPSFCHACGRAYPWLEERLRTARELLDHDDQLTEGDRKSLWPDLQYVMSNPKADLIPAKKKLIDIKLGKATGWVREAILDLTAKTIAEMTKG